MTVPAGAALGGARHCGAGRIIGGIYLESNTQKVGLSEYVLDPPQEVDPIQFALPSQGMARLVEEDGSVHFLDRIGRSHYPQAADFLREAQSKGISRRFPGTLSLEGVDERSTLILLHDRGFPPEPSRLPSPSMPCPQGQHSDHEACAAHHFTPDPGCPPAQMRLHHAGSHQRHRSCARSRLR